MLYPFKFFLILSVGVSSIDYLSQHVGPSTSSSKNPLRMPSTSRNRKEPFNEQTQDSAVSSRDVSFTAGKSNLQVFKEESSHSKTNFHVKENRQKKTTGWRRSLKSSLVHTNQHFEKQTKPHHHLIKRRYVSHHSRRYINRPQHFGVHFDISSNILVSRSHSPADGLNGSFKSSVDSKTHEHNPSCSFTKFCIDCSSKNLTDVLTYPFPDTVTKYTLSRNLITRISDFAFKRYSALEVLDLSRNKLHSLCNDSFAGLGNLRRLRLLRNELYMTALVFPANVFAPLESLEILRINRNNPHTYLNNTNMTYPDVALSKLRKLRELYMDGLQDKDFGPGFKDLIQLDTLSLSGQMGNCKLHSLKNTTFVSVPNVRNLTLDLCDIRGDSVEADTFSRLTKLVYLNLNDNDNIGLKHLNKILYGLRNITTLKFLLLTQFRQMNTIGFCLDSKYISHFPQNLKYLEAGWNALEGVDRGVIGKLSPSLERLHVSGNSFAFGSYLADLPKMKNLTTLHYNGYINEKYAPRLPVEFPSDETLMEDASESSCSISKVDFSDALEDRKLIFKLPEKLKYVEMNEAGLMFLLTEFNIDPDNELESLSMYGNHFPKLIGPITGLPKLKTLYLNSSNIHHISAYFFKNLTSLEYLDLSSNLLTTVYDESRNLSVFTTLQNLKFLNLSCNEITRLHILAFQSLVNLTELYLRHIRLEKFEVNMSSMILLEMLDLSDNFISFLPPIVTDYIDHRQSQHGNFTLNLADCHIPCNCDNFDFLKWFSQSKFKIDQRYVGNYRCTGSDNSFKYLEDRYQSTFAVLSKLCVTNYIVYMVTAASSIVLFCVILGAIIYRFRWNIRYIYYAAYLRYKKLPKSCYSDYEFDVFISYAEEDSDFVIDTMSPELERRGIKMLIHGRDFKAGEYIASNIVNAVCSSKKTLVVLTRDMMNSYWCGYELQMANMESVQRGGKVLIFLLVEKISESELGVELLYNIRNNTYIPYPDTLPDDTSMGRLWDKLVADINN